MKTNAAGLGLYVHIPFCRQKCFYCDFPSYAGKEELYEAYTAALCREITAQGGSFADAVVDTIYFGGGTPTVLTINQLRRLCEAVKQNFHLSADLEWTIEANPGTVNLEKLTTLRHSGINRISFGVQSFEDHLLTKIGRLHTAAEAKTAVCLAEQAGFKNSSLDLMYALPGQTLADLEASLKTALTLPVCHISIYGLMIEEGTAFFKLAEKGKLNLISAELEEAMYDYLLDTLDRHGFKRYEIANFAKGGAVSRHNLRYWQDKPYLGLGVSASSYIGCERFSNVRRVEEYIERIAAGRTAVVERETLSEAVLQEEFCFLALRTARGIEKAAFSEKFKRPVTAVYGAVIAKLIQKGLLAESATHLYLTRHGMKYGNLVFQEFILT